MTRRRTALNTSSSILAIVAAGKGGVGKTTIATLIADEAALAEHPLVPFQVDDQRRLGAMLGARVHTILPDYEAALRSPRALTSPFAPLYNACAAAGQGGPSPLLDVGPNHVALCTMWIRKAELGEDLATWGVKPVVFVPALAETESLRQAIETIRLFDLALPGATLAFVENQRDGRFVDLRPHADTALLIKDELLPLIGERHYLTMPLIEGEAWAAYESHNLRFIKAMEGVAFEAYVDAGTSGGLTLERFYNTATGNHHYSASAAETYGINHGSAGANWVDEGPGFTVHVPIEGM